jgi:glycine cleavage system aminomethyltransferase T
LPFVNTDITEKGYRLFGHELELEYNPVEAGLAHPEVKSQDFIIRHDRPDAYAPEAWTRGVAHLIEARGPDAVMAPGTDRGNELNSEIRKLKAG